MSLQRLFLFYECVENLERVTFEESIAVSELPMEVSCQEVKGALDASEQLLLVDCREEEEHQTVSIKGAILLPMSQLVERVGELECEQHRQIVVHCHHGGRSLQVANWLRQQGYGNAQSMQGGIDVWAEEIEPGMTRY